MKRYKYNLSHYKLATFDMGELIPVGCVEVLPGDTFQHVANALVRLSPLATPVYHPIQAYIHHFYVPNRLVYEDWEDFITGGRTGDFDGEWPYMSRPTGVVQGGLSDYLGLPITYTTSNALLHSALPVRAYQLIYNEYYRDDDLVSPVVVSTAGGLDTTTNTLVQKVSWEKDYATMARSEPYEGPLITIPVEPDGSNPTVNPGNRTIVGTAATNAVKVSGAALAADSVLSFSNPGLKIDIDDFRRSMALYRWGEARARYGSRYTEYLRYLGVKASDSRLERPEYLGGGVDMIQVSEVLQTAPTTSGSAVGVADMKGHAIAGLKSNRYRRFFPEHGLVMSLMFVRPKHMYTQAMHRMYNRRTRFDYYQPELVNIGDQPILNHEVWAPGPNPYGTFGFGPRYDEYRMPPASSVHGDFRTSLDDWHMARNFTAMPAPNSSFLECAPSKRNFIVQSTDVVWAMIQHNLVARRPVPYESQRV